MSERTIAVKIRAEYQGYKSAMADIRAESAKTAAFLDRDGNKITSTTGRMIHSANTNREAWEKSGRALTLFGAAGAAALVFSARAAIDWEAAWAGVLKTVDGTHDELATLQDDLRAMALVLPASQTEIANVAAAAGQLGVKVKDVAAFTRVMIDLGQTTNLSAEEAATSIARMANIMGTSISDIARMGATIVDLGNNSATTEAEIVDLGLRLAAAGKQAGLSESQVLAFASALTSVGVPSEAAGTAISKVMTSISDAVKDGGDDLETFAQVAGVSTEEFQRAFEQDAAGAIGSFIEGMGRMSSSGQSTTAIFDNLGLADERLKRSVLSLGSAHGLLTDQLALASTAWEDNTALVEEANKRYDTTEAKIAIARNALNEAAITIGEELLPMLASLATGVADVSEWFAGLPEPVKKAVAGLGGVTTGAALAAGGFLLLFPRVVETVGSLTQLGLISPRATARLASLSKAAGYAGLAGAFIAVAVAAKQGIDALTDASPSLVDVRNQLATAADGADLLSESMINVGANMTGFNKIADDMQGKPWWQFGASAADWVGNTVSTLFGAGDSVVKAADEIRVMDDALAGFAAIDLTSSQKQFQLLAEGFGAVSDEDFATVLDALPKFRDALTEQATAQGLAADDATLLALATGKIKVSTDAAIDSTTVGTSATDDATDATQSYVEALTAQIDAQHEAAGIALNEFDALTNYADAVDGATAALYDENGALIEGAATLNEHTQAGRDNRDALSNLVDSTFAWLEAGDAAGVGAGELYNRMEEGRQAFINSAIQMGLTADEAAALADKMNLIPTAVYTPFETPGLATALSQVNALNDAIRRIPGSTRYAIEGYSTHGGSTFAGGGAIHGPGTSVSDDVPIWASDGEYMVKAAAHSFWGTRGMDAINNADTGSLMQILMARGLADGGSATGTTFPMIGSASPNVNVSMAGMLEGSKVVVDIGGQAFDAVIRTVVQSERGAASGVRKSALRGRG